MPTKPPFTSGPYAIQAGHDETQFTSMANETGATMFDDDEDDELCSDASMECGHQSLLTSLSRRLE